MNEILGLERERFRANSFQRWIQQLAAKPAISALLASVLHRVDRFVLWVSGGRATATSWLSGLPVVVLTTTGARSHRPRSVPLVGLFEGDDIVVVASNFGSRRHPSWYLNLRAAPAAILTYRGRAVAVIAREASGEEYERCWATAVQRYRGFQAYAHRARGRQIPIILLHPQTTAPGRKPTPVPAA